MKFTLSWLKYHLETDATLDQIVEKLTMIGLEVESVDDKAALKPFRHRESAYGREASRCRQAAQCCRSIPGTGDPVQVVCGAPNARAGLVGAFAAPGHLMFPASTRTLSIWQHPRRGKPWHDVFGARIDAVGRA